MQSVKSIRAVERAFAVLEALQNAADGATLADLQRATGLSKPTLLRLLKTLIQVKAVRRGMADQKYRTAVQLNLLGRGVTALERLAEISAPILDELCQQLEWPSDVLIHQEDDDCMMVLESNLRRSRFYVRRRVGRSRVNLLGSAGGLAFLSALRAERVEQLREAARHGADPHNTKIIARGDLDQVLETVRARGYAARHPLYRGGSYRLTPRDDRLFAIAVPILGDHFVLGAVNVNWNRQAHSEQAMAAMAVEPLQQAATRIAKAVKEQGIEAALGRVNLKRQGLQ